MNKPKEFWIAYCTRNATEEVFSEEKKVGDVFYDGYNAEKVLADKVTHVIEYSAYKKAKEVGDAWLFDLLEMTKERDQLKAALKEIKEHSEPPFMSDRWMNYVNEVALIALGGRASEEKEV